MEWYLLERLRREGGHEKAAEEAIDVLKEKQTARDKGDGNEGARDTYEISTIMALVRIELDASLTEGTERQESPLFRYCGMYCAPFGIEMGRFGNNGQENEDDVREMIRKERMILAGFARFVLTYPRRSGQSDKEPKMQK